MKFSFSLPNRTAFAVCILLPLVSMAQERVTEQYRQQVEQEARQAGEERQRAEEQQRQAAERERQQRAEQQPVARSTYPACSNLAQTGDFAWRFRDCEEYESLREASRIISVTFHDNCEWRNSRNHASVIFNLPDTSWFADIKPGWRNGGPQIPDTDFGAAQFGLSYTWIGRPYVYDSRRSDGRNVRFSWSLQYPEGTGPSGNKSVNLVDGGVYSYRGDQTSSVPSCAR